MPAAHFCLRRILLKGDLACSEFFFKKNLVCGAFDFGVWFGLTIHWY